MINRVHYFLGVVVLVIALAGCGDDSSDLQRALDRIERLDPTVTAFCLKNAECYPGYYYEDIDYCRMYDLYYADFVVQLSHDPAACYDAGRSYFECFTEAECGTAELECTDEWAAVVDACSYDAMEGSQ